MFLCSTHGFCIGHVVPEAFEGGPIGLVKDGDIIAIDVSIHLVGNIEKILISCDLTGRKKHPGHRGVEIRIS